MEPYQPSVFTRYQHSEQTHHHEANVAKALAPPTIRVDNKKKHAPIRAIIAAWMGVLAWIAFAAIAPLVTRVVFAFGD